MLLCLMPCCLMPCCLMPCLMPCCCVSVLATCRAQDTFYFSTKPADMDVVDGTETRLRCDVSNRRHIVFQWVQHGRPVHNSTRRFQEDSNLRILRVSRDEDQGPFQCVATNVTTGFSLQSFEARLNIQCKCWIHFDYCVSGLILVVYDII